MTDTPGKSDRILVGHIAGPHGIRGDVLIKSYTAVPEDVASYGPLETQAGDTIIILRCRQSSKGVVAALKGITNRNEAEALRGTQLHVVRDMLPETEENEWYISDLIGLSVTDEMSRKIGSVVTVHDFGAGELLELDLIGYSQSKLVPFTREIVPEVCIDEQRLTVHLTPDLLDDDDAEGEDDV